MKIEPKFYAQIWSALGSPKGHYSLKQKVDLEMRGDRINGVQAQMVKFENFVGINILKILLRHNDNVSKTIQSPKITASVGVKLSNVTVKTLIVLSSDRLFNNLWEKLIKETNTLGIEASKTKWKTTSGKRNSILLWQRRSWNIL